MGLGVRSAISQETEPFEALEIRRLNAETAVHTREVYSAAQGEFPLELEQAFAEFAKAPLSEPTFLSARRRKLDAARETCAREHLETRDPELRVRVAVTRISTERSVSSTMPPHQAVTFTSTSLSR